MRATRIAWPLRAWLAVEILFGVAASLAVGLAPADTKPISPGRSKPW